EFTALIGRRRIVDLLCGNGERQGGTWVLDSVAENASMADVWMRRHSSTIRPPWIHVLFLVSPPLVSPLSDASTPPISIDEATSLHAHHHQQPPLKRRISASQPQRGKEIRSLFFRIAPSKSLPASSGCCLVPTAAGNLLFSRQVLAGLLNPNGGTFHVKRPKSFVFQNPDHQVVMPTVEADVSFGLGKFDLPDNEVRSRVSKALDAVGMASYMQRPVQTLSGGQKQRVAIAGALAEACKVLLLDELTTFLDETDQIGVIKALKNTLDVSDDVTALWVTHRLEELEYADGALYMENGRVVKKGDGSRIKNFIKARQASYFNQINQ
ncbi:ABC transporter I family member 10, partial [Linum perenne]